MARKIIVVTAAYGNDRVKALGGQSAVLPFIAGSGADGVEIRRELFSADELNHLPELAADIERRGLLVCYSAPEALFTADGSLNPRLADFLQEAQTLNALWLKLSLGRFTHQNDLDTLRDILRESGMALVVENDQTDCGQLAPMQRFKAACRVNQLPITLTFDMGNWLWVGDSPEEAARLLFLAARDPAALERPELDIHSEAKAWKEIWSAGQGVGSIADLPGAAELADRLAAEYAAARAALA